METPEWSSRRMKKKKKKNDMARGVNGPQSPCKAPWWTGEPSRSESIMIANDCLTAALRKTHIRIKKKKDKWIFNLFVVLLLPRSTLTPNCSPASAVSQCCTEEEFKCTKSAWKPNNSKDLVIFPVTFSLMKTVNIGDADVAVQPINSRDTDF